MTVWWAVAEVAAACLLAALLAARQARRQTERHDRLATVVSLLTDVLAEPDDRAAGDGMMARLAALMGADSGTLGLPVGDRMVVIGSYGLEGPSRTLLPGQGLAGRCWVQGRPLVVADLAAEPEYVEGGGQARSGIYVPARADGRVHAVLVLEARRPGAFSERDLRVLQPVADLIGTVATARRRDRAAADLERRLLPMLAEATGGHLARLERALDTLADPRSASVSGAARDAGREATARLEAVVAGLLDAAEHAPSPLVDREVDGLLADALGRYAAGPGGTVSFGVDTTATAGVSVPVDSALLVPALASVLATATGGVLRARTVGRDVVLSVPGDPRALSAHVCRRVAERSGGLLVPGPGGTGVVLTLRRRVQLPAPAAGVLPGPTARVPVPVGPRPAPDRVSRSGVGG